MPLELSRMIFLQFSYLLTDLTSSVVIYALCIYPVIKKRELLNSLRQFLDDVIDETADFAG